MSINRFIKHTVGVLLCMSCFTSCEKDTDSNNFAPSVFTGDFDNVYRKGATLNGIIQNPQNGSIEDFGIEYSLYYSFSEPTKVSANEGANHENFNITLADLNPNTPYFYRTYAYSGYSYIYGEPRSFATAATTPPAFGTTTISEIDYTSCHASAQLLDDGGSDIQITAFLYTEVEKGTTVENVKLTLNENPTMVACDANFSVKIENLKTNTTYAIRPYGVANGVGYGEIQLITTRELTTEESLLSACVVSDTLTTNPLVSADILAEGTTPLVEFGFCYSTENDEPTVDNIKLIGQRSNSKITASWSDLEYNVDYYIRVFAKEETGNYIYGAVTKHKVSFKHILNVTTLRAELYSKGVYTLSGRIDSTNLDIKECGFCWITEDQFVTHTNITIDNAYRKVANNLSNNSFSLNLNVEEKTRYRYVAYAINTDGQVAYGSIVDFETEDKVMGLANVLINGVKELTDSSAVVAGSISLNYDIQSSTSIHFGFTVTQKDNNQRILEELQAIPAEAFMNDNPIPYEIPVNGLLSNTTYVCEAYVINEYGMSKSNVFEFTTKKPAPSQGDIQFPTTNNGGFVEVNGKQTYFAYAYTYLNEETHTLETLYSTIDLMVYYQDPSKISQSPLFSCAKLQFKNMYDIPNGTFADYEFEMVENVNVAWLMTQQNSNADFVRYSTELLSKSPIQTTHQNNLYGITANDIAVHISTKGGDGSVTTQSAQTTVDFQFVGELQDITNVMNDLLTKKMSRVGVNDKDFVRFLQILNLH